MPIVEILVTKLAVPIAKLLVKRYFQESFEEVGGGLVEMTGEKITDFIQRRETEREVEGLSEKIVKQLEPLFSAAELDQANCEAVAFEVAQTLEGKISAEFFVEEDLDPTQLTAAFHLARPLPVGIFNSTENTLYKKSLDAIVRYLVEVSSQLPTFEVEAASASLKRLRHVSNAVDSLLATTQRIERGVEELNARAISGDSKSSRYEADYRQAVIRNLDFVELFGADIKPESARQSLSVAYVSLNLQSREAGNKNVSMSVESVLNNLSPSESRLLVRGEAGSGKSTLFRWTSIESASMRSSEIATAGQFENLQDASNLQELIQRTQHKWANKIPFLLRIRDWPDGQLPSPEQLPLQVARELGNPPEDWVQKILHDGRGIILFDGVDEIPKIHRQSLKDSIKAIVSTYPKNYYILSTRPAAVPPYWLHDLKFREASVDPMSEEDKFAFIDKWHQAVAHELEEQGVINTDLEVIAKELKAKLPLVPSISRLATNPLLCAMICAIHRDRNKNLPQTQTELCEVICHMLLHRREQESRIPIEKFSDNYRNLSYEHKRSIIREIAHYMARNGESSVSTEIAVRIVKAAISNLSGCSTLDPVEVLKGLVERSGVLRENRPGYIDFIHNTIKDYLASERFVEDSDLGALASAYSDGDMQQIVLFAAGTRSGEFSKKLIIRILEPEKRISDQERHSRRLFALRCMSMSIYRDEELDKKIKDIEETLFPPSNMHEAEALATMGDDAIKYLSYREDLSEEQAAASARTLRLIGSRRSNDELSDYFADTREVVMSELAQNVNPLLLKFVVSSIVAEHPLPLFIKQKIRDVIPLQGNDQIHHLDLRGTRVNSLLTVKELKKLVSLNISDLGFKNLDFAEEIPSLEILRVGRNLLQDVSAVSFYCQNLKELYLWGNPLSEVGPISNLVHLERLDIDSTRIESIEGIEQVSKLKYLELSNTKVVDISPLANCKQLEELQLIRTHVSDLSPLAGLPNLRRLILSHSQVEDLSPLEGMSLEILDIRGLSVSLPATLRVGTLIGRPLS